MRCRLPARRSLGVEPLIWSHRATRSPIQPVNLGSASRARATGSIAMRSMLAARPASLRTGTGSSAMRSWNLAHDAARAPGPFDLGLAGRVVILNVRVDRRVLQPDETPHCAREPQLGGARATSHPNRNRSMIKREKPSGKTGQAPPPSSRAKFITPPRVGHLGGHLRIRPLPNEVPKRRTASHQVRSSGAVLETSGPRIDHEERSRTWCQEQLAHDKTDEQSTPPTFLGTCV